MSEIENLKKLKSELTATLEKVSRELKAVEYKEGLDLAVNHTIPQALLLMKHKQIELMNISEFDGVLGLQFLGPKNVEGKYYDEWQKVCRVLEPLKPYWVDVLGSPPLGAPPPFIKWEWDKNIRIYAQSTVVLEWIKKTGLKVNIDNYVKKYFEQKIQKYQKEIQERQIGLLASQESLNVVSQLQQEQSNQIQN